MTSLYVCIVSDAAVVAESLAMGVTLHGHRPAVFASADHLLASAELPESCAVISNFMKGGAVERELAQRVYDCAPKIPLYFIASSIFTRGALLSAPQNVAGIFDSPCNPDDVFDAIRETCICEPPPGHARPVNSAA